jgi:transcriptional regulator with XRE-family HTH domain
MFPARDNPSGTSDFMMRRPDFGYQECNLSAVFQDRFFFCCALSCPVTLLPKELLPLSSDVTFRLRHNLVILLKERGLTASQLSRKTGVAKQVLSDWMSGVQPRKIEQLYLVAKELGVSIETICFARSDEDLLAIVANSSKSGFGAGGAASVILGMSGDALKQGVISPDEIRGRFEIHLRRISDD